MDYSLLHLCQQWNLLSTPNVYQTELNEQFFGPSEWRFKKPVINPDQQGKHFNAILSNILYEKGSSGLTVFIREDYPNECFEDMSDAIRAINKIATSPLQNVWPFPGLRCTYFGTVKTPFF